ncbi:MAG TPA: nucleoside diphosphate kinase regulator [Thermoanaerobaculia bacterium]|nr:nucleoside diphosphate kinase regulator [Thermoanaerobaculia bacterium]
MTERRIYVTTQDHKRLELISRMADENTDRDDLRDLADELRQASVVAPEEIPADVITMRSRVRLLDLDQGAPVEYTLVYPNDADFSAGKISILAPIGTAMLGYREGDEIDWPVPGGRRRLRVEAVLYQPEAAGDYHL